jgi:hypothetical protein
MPVSWLRRHLSAPVPLHHPRPSTNSTLVRRAPTWRHCVTARPAALSQAGQATRPYSRQVEMAHEARPGVIRVRVGCRARAGRARRRGTCRRGTRPPGVIAPRTGSAAGPPPRRKRRAGRWCPRRRRRGAQPREVLSGRAPAAAASFGGPRCEARIADMTPKGPLSAHQLALLAPGPQAAASQAPPLQVAIWHWPVYWHGMKAEALTSRWMLGCIEPGSAQPRDLRRSPFQPRAAAHRHAAARSAAHCLS